ncbi:DNA mismatch endonuclease (patch repair protein) [Methylobacterium fujisawaense]|uniref:Very short patch repair endonuclease n=1 Tax=Methylobacterium fujisawaense TaxID=107400 RepID=A0ABR6DHQ8_9HYPH|nr:very short patch repair endonuclease [Methylobacterium fujisawaense]MBA9065641.1 DNA mismatch endonuclease (patch repair protein) [Methylobacterium fujisawaense]
MDAESRRRLMARFRGRDTKPEVAARRVLHRLGYRFRLHRKDLPGRPDIVLPRHGAVIFVHGCFWHRHSGCRVATMPKTRPDFWRQKFEQNTQRDARNIAKLHAAGWRVLVLWECETKDRDKMAEILLDFLKPLPPFDAAA